MRPVVMGLLLPRHSKNLTKPLLLNSSVQWLSHVRLSAIPWTTAHQPSLSITNSRSLFKLMPVELVMPSNYFILCRPLFLLTSIFPTISIFSKESTLCIRWPMYWSFSFSISPSDEYWGLIAFKMDWMDLLDLPAVQGTLKSLLQHHSSKASILRRSTFFTVQLSHQYITTGKTTALTRWTLKICKKIKQYPFSHAYYFGFESSYLA